jgi:hypothetical protein
MGRKLRRYISRAHHELLFAVWAEFGGHGKVKQDAMKGQTGEECWGALIELKRNDTIGMSCN